MKQGKDLARKSSYNPGPAMQLPLFADLMAEYGLNEFISMGLNENPLPPSEKVLEAINQAARNANRYPDNTSTLLRRKISAHFGIQPDMVILSNGADELVYALGKAFLEDGDQVVLTQPSYYTYFRAIASMGGELVNVPLTADYRNDLDAMLAAITPQTKMVILCNPGNPSSTINTEQELARFMAKVPPDCLVVLDEAYAEFCTHPDYPCSVKHLNENGNIIILRTFSKFYSLAGLRIGYGMAPAHIIEVLRRVIAPFAANSLAQAAALAAMDDESHHKQVYALLKEAKEYLSRELTAFGFDVVKSHTNFLFMDTHLDEPRKLVDALMKKGIMISGPSGGYPRNIRITVGTMKQNRELIQAMKEILGK